MALWSPSFWGSLVCSGFFGIDVCLVEIPQHPLQVLAILWFSWGNPIRNPKWKFLVILFRSHNEVELFQGLPLGTPTSFGCTF